VRRRQHGTYGKHYIDRPRIASRRVSRYDAHRHIPPFTFEKNMHLRHATLALALMAAFGLAHAAAPACDAQSALSYPVTAKVAQTDNYHGTQIADPYRWLEDANSAETKQWVDAQNAVTQAYLNQIPQREAIRQRLTKLWNYERYSVPSKEGGRYFYSRNDGLQNQSVLYTMKSLNDATSRPAATSTTTSSGSSSRRRHGPRTAKASSTAATTSRKRRPSWPASIISRSSTSTGSAPRKAPTPWSTTVLTKRNGASAPRPPTTADTC
jgi:hypothetical protein